VIGQDLADQLGLDAGSRIEIFAYGRRLLLVVDRIVARNGVAGYWDGPEGKSLNVFVPMGTIVSLAGASADGADAPQSLVFVSNKGGVEAGAKLTLEATRRIEAALGPIPAEVRPVKRDVLQAAEQAGRQFATLLAAMGTFGVAAGILLLVNVFVMLADERRPELGMLRALGMRRRQLVAAFSTEGWLYSIVAAIVGALAGIGLGRLIVIAFAPLFAGGVERFSLELQFSARPISLVAGFASGFVIGLATVVVTSVRISRLNIIQAIRSLNEPPLSRALVPPRVVGAVITTVGMVLSAVAIIDHDGFAVLLGPIVALGGIALFVANGREHRGTTSVWSAVSLAWAGLGFPNAIDPSRGEINSAVFVVQGLVLTGVAVVLLSANQEVIGGALRRVGLSDSLSVHVGLAYPLARRFRTAMILAMFALVIFTLTFLSVFRHMFAAQAGQLTERLGGNIDIIVQANPGSTVAVDTLVTHPGVKAGASLATVTARAFLAGEADPRTITMSVYDEQWVTLGPPELIDPGGYPDANAAYRAVLADPSLVLVDPLFFSSARGGRAGLAGGGPPDRREFSRLRVGKTLTIIDPRSGREREVRIAALASGGLASAGLYYGAPGANELFARDLRSSEHYLAVRGDPERVAAEITADHLNEGVQVQAVTELVEQFRTSTVQFLQVIQAYLALGLLVGIAGLAVTMVRAVRERRREIGMLRALGFVSRTVRRSFVVESTFVAAEGAVLGVVLALITSYTLVSNAGEFATAFRWSVPVVTLVLLVAGVVAAALLATLIPAQAAARIRPAVALRIAD
jgi:putative ABC transport system permease protein